MKKGRQTQVVNLVRQLLLKRFESSIAAFEETCIRIFVRLRKFVDDYREYGNERAITRFFQRRERITEYIEKYSCAFGAMQKTVISVFFEEKIKMSDLARFLCVKDTDISVDTALKSLIHKPVELSYAPRKGELAVVGFKAVK